MSLMDVYLRDFDRLSNLYQYNPSDFSSYVDRTQFLASQDFGNRSELVDTLGVYNQRLGCGQRTEENLQKLLNHETLAIVTGQQAGLFTGPLYTIYKACTAVVLADLLQKKLNREVVPIFWVASEDHDFEEINHIYTIAEKGTPEKISMSKRPFGKPSVGEIALPGNWAKLVDKLSYNTPETEHKADIITMLEETGKSSQNLGEWFAKIMVSLFKEQGLIFIDPMLPGVRKHLAKGVQQALEITEIINERVSEKEEAHKELSLVPQIITSEMNTNLFIYQNGQREALHKLKDKFFTANNPNQCWSKEEIMDLAIEEPTRFSPNVVLRPIFQDLILPTLCYVAGPGEIAYYAQLKEVYPLFGLQMPVIYPRKRLTLVEPHIAELLEKYNLNYEQVQEGLRSTLDGILKDSLPVDIDSEIKNFMDTLESQYGQLLGRLAEIDLGMEKLGEKNLSRIKYQLEYLRDKAWQKHRKNNKKLSQDFRKIENYFSFHRKPQERVYNLMTFLINRGPSLLEELMTKVDYEDFNHQVLTLGDESSERC